MPGEEAPEGPFPIRPPTGTRQPALAAGAAQAVHQQPTGSEPGPPPTSPDSLTLPSATTSRFRNFNPIPFRCTRLERYQTGFPRPLGSTNPCASAVHMEPFPSSAFKVLI